MLTIEQTKAVYRMAIEPRASDAEGDSWWGEVQAELVELLGKPTLRESAAVIAWWHHDWRMVGDTAMAAARRLRSAAKRLPRLTADSPKDGR